MIVGGVINGRWCSVVVVDRWVDALAECCCWINYCMLAREKSVAIRSNKLFAKDQEDRSFQRSRSWILIQLGEFGETGMRFRKRTAEGRRDGWEGSGVVGLDGRSSTGRGSWEGRRGDDSGSSMGFERSDVFLRRTGPSE